MISFRFPKFRTFNICVHALIAVLFIASAGCNRDDEILAEERPVIEFDHADGIYSVMVGESLILAPRVENGVGADYLWTMDDVVVGYDPVLTISWDDPGEYYLLLTVRNSGGVDREEVRVDVEALLPPVISLPIDGDRLTLKVGSEYLFEPVIGHVAGDDKPEIAWSIDGEQVAEGLKYRFTADRIGTFDVTISLKCGSGVASRTIIVDVVESLPSSLKFMPLSAIYNDNVRSTVVGRPVALHLIADNLNPDDIKWLVDGRSAAGSGQDFVFVSDEVGSHKVIAEANGLSASMIIDVYEAPVATTSFASASSIAQVLEWIPAPGQFIGETSSVADMPSDITTMSQACEWACGRLKSNRFVSLGAWGGYIVMSLGAPIRAHGSGVYDFAIMGNAITTSNEPGIVWVMQDANGNGEPDDAWYQLRGSDFNNSEYYASATYYRPAGSRMPVLWTSGNTQGEIDYISGTHNQPSYYPSWVTSDCYTLYGSRLPARNTQNPVTGLWTNEAFAWGYADNMGSDMITSGDDYSTGQWVGFSIANAVLPDGTKVDLDRIDFVKVQTAVMAKSGKLGELSTEVCAIKAL